jgi:hypothetical protein
MQERKRKKNSMKYDFLREKKYLGTRGWLEMGIA